VRDALRDEVQGGEVVDRVEGPEERDVLEHTAIAYVPWTTESSPAGPVAGRFSGRPRRKSSTTTTPRFCLVSASRRCEPMNPAPPVTSVVIRN
jgi:hypothetical protein